MTCHPREAMARQRKARLIADVLQKHGADSASAAALLDDGRIFASQLAGVGRPSDATWAVVVAILEDRTAVRPTSAPNVEALV